MSDPYAIPTLLMLSVVTGIFGVIWARHRSASTLFVFAGWVAMCTHIGLELVSRYLGTGVELMSAFALLATPVLFVTSVAPDSFSLGRRRVPYFLVFLVPQFLLVVGTQWNLSAASGFWVCGGALVASTMVSLWWARSNANFSRWLSVGLVTAGFVCAIATLVFGSKDSAFSIVIAEYFFLTALGFFAVYAKRTPGSVLVLCGLAGWGSVFVIYVFSSKTPHATQVLTMASDLFKIVTSVGMVVYLLEEEVRLAADARRQEERLCEELHHYTRLFLKLVPGVSQKNALDPVCEAVARHSPFRSCALVLRAPESGIHMLCGVGLGVAVPAALESALREQDLVLSRAAGDAGATEGMLTELALHGLDAAAGGPVTGYLLPLISQSSTIKGWLWLSDVRHSAQPLDERRLAPLRSLASRLVSALDNRELSNQLIRSDRLAGLGKLAGGIAHELNNPLTIVKGYAELIREAGGGATTEKQADIILQEADRMQRIIADMNQFWRSSGGQHSSIDVARLLQAVESMFRVEMQRRGIRLTTQMAGGLTVYGAFDSLRQVVLQLLNNAMEAVARRTAGHTAESSMIRLEASRVGDRVRILVSDNGVGFTDPDRAFDPFYTTKNPGAGTGLGLSVCYGLVRQHKGEITAMNLPTGGAAVLVDLPAGPVADLEPEEQESALAVE